MFIIADCGVEDSQVTLQSLAIHDAMTRRRSTQGRAVEDPDQRVGQALVDGPLDELRHQVLDHPSQAIAKAIATRATGPQSTNQPPRGHAIRRQFRPLGW